MQVRLEKHDGVSKISARVRLSAGIHRFLLTHVGYEKRHEAVKILALVMQVRPPDGLWAIMRGRLRTQENRPKLQSIRALLGNVAPATMAGTR
jgi:hypothetical protein